MSEELATEQEKTIARVVLGGWQLVPVKDVAGGTRYRVISPAGQYVYNASTRYTAACAAEMLMYQGDALESLVASDGVEVGV